MTSLGRMDQASEGSNQPPQGAHKSRRGTRRRPTGRFSLLRNKGTWFWIVVSLIALVGVALVVDGGSHQATSGATSAATGGAPASSSSLKASQANQAPNSSSQANRASNSNSQAKGKVPSAVQAAESAGALSLPATMQSSVIAWQSGPGGKDLAAVTRLFGDALQAEALRQHVQMRSACVQLAHGVSTAEAGPQIPVGAMQTLYGKALAELAKGAADCQAAIAIKPGDEELEANVNDAMLQQAASELAAGSKDIFRSTAEIEIASR